MIALGGRLRAALELLPNAGPIADVGAGDGRLSLRLARLGHEGPIYATEIAEDPLRRLTAAVGGEPRIQVLRGDGLAPLRGFEVQCVALLGMGPRTILDILRLHAEFPGCAFVLGPMQGAQTLREGLRALSLEILDERLARERRRFYALLRVSAGGVPREMDLLDDLLGPCLRRDRPPGFMEFVQLTRRRLEGEIRKSPPGTRRDLADALSRLKEEYDAPR